MAVFSPRLVASRGRTLGRTDYSDVVDLHSANCDVSSHGLPLGKEGEADVTLVTGRV